MSEVHILENKSKDPNPEVFSVKIEKGPIDRTSETSLKERTTESVSSARTALEFQYVNQRIDSIEKRLEKVANPDIALVVQEMKMQLDLACQFSGDRRGIHLLNAKNCALKAWKALDGVDKYKSHALNLLFTVLHHNDFEEASPNILQILADLGKDISRSELDQAAKIDLPTMKSYSRLLIRSGVRISAY